MGAIHDYIRENRKAIECASLRAFGLEAYSKAWRSIWSRQFVEGIGFTLVGGAFELTYALNGCNDQGQLPLPPAPDWPCCECSEESSIWILSPAETDVPIDGGGGIGRIDGIGGGDGGGDPTGWYDSGRTATKLIGWRADPDCPEDEEALFYISNGQEQKACFPDNSQARLKCEAECLGQCDEPPDFGNEPIGPDQEFEDGNCIWTITPIDAYVDYSGLARIKYRVVPSSYLCGDIYCYWTGPEGYIDDPDCLMDPPTACDGPQKGEKGDPGPEGPQGPQGPVGPQGPAGSGDGEGGGCSCDHIDVKFAEVNAKLDTIIQSQKDDDGNDVWVWIYRIWDALAVLMVVLGTNEQGEELYPGTKYTLTGVCEQVGEGQPQPTKERTIVQTKGLYAVIARVDALMLFMQDHLGYRTPVCGPSPKPELQGQWVTTRWISDEKMVDSSRRLRKLFRYRTKSTRDLGQLSAYWESFTWRAGSVCVIHKGAWWGTPQVWAESAEEGERVLRHAAAEAGINPDKTGEWIISGSDSARYGMSGTMRVLKHADFPWVASRDGANWPNMLAKRRDP
jgi:hypothetical protein